MKIAQQTAHRLLQGVVTAFREAQVLHKRQCSWSLETELGYVYGVGHVAFAAHEPELENWLKDLKGLELRATKLLINDDQNQTLVSYGLIQNAPLAELFVGNPGLRFTKEAALGLLRSLEREFTPISVGSVVSTEKHLRDSQVAVAELHASLRELTNQIVRTQAEAVAHLGKQRAALEKEFEDRRTELKASSDAALAEAQRALDERTKALDAKEKEFDLRDEQLVRRRLLDEIQKELEKAQTPRISATTAGLRTQVRKIVALVEIVSGAVIGIGAGAISKSSTLEWYHFTSIAVPFAAFLSTAIWFLRWEERWFRDHANQEFLASRYRADMLRASWTAELAAELQKKEKGEIPPELLQAMTRGLFAPTTEASPEHPFEQVLSMVRRGTEISIKKDEFGFRASDPKKD